METTVWGGFRDRVRGIWGSYYIIPNVGSIYRLWGPCGDFYRHGAPGKKNFVSRFRARGLGFGLQGSGFDVGATRLKG